MGMHDTNPTDEEAGAVPATRSTVLAYLMSPKGGSYTQDKAVRLMVRGRDVIEAGMRDGLFAYYVGDQLRAQDMKGK
jgi:hypothetical protein